MLAAVREICQLSREAWAIRVIAVDIEDNVPSFHLRRPPPGVSKRSAPKKEAPVAYWLAVGGLTSPPERY
ncbi:hypothetical protein GUJ93_ZPchr0002g23980 [Zizania palustris]|uniref:Uncharacterized protein n=1 Tax=Zizania palustris TaxID=103762 RepID=A0A8J5S2U5_ZIZPA|nr:hypothetical protein GUJ93_ZPchr0002g23980 [Zizania palustris]